MILELFLHAVLDTSAGSKKRLQLEQAKKKVLGLCSIHLVSKEVRLQTRGWTIAFPFLAARKNTTALPLVLKVNRGGSSARMQCRWSSASLAK